jgi:hypothetical protein
MGILKYPLPAYLNGELTPYRYSRWVCMKSATVRNRDLRLGRPFAKILSHEDYGNALNEAVIACNGIDPFTGEKLRFDLVGKFDPAKAVGDIVYEKSFDLMPTVDHIDPEAGVLALQICSFRINSCKNEQTPEEFLAMCRKIVEDCEKKVYGKDRPQKKTLKSDRLKNPAEFFPPDFSQGKCSVGQYRKWVLGHSKNMYLRDRKANRPFAYPGQKSLYRHTIDDAAHHGQFDPYTGDVLLWELIGEWDPNEARGNRDYAKKFALLPTVDHIDPASDVLEFEICSWKINMCKGNLNPQDFIELCRRVVKYAERLTPQ